MSDRPRAQIDRPHVGRWLQWKHPFDFEWNRVSLGVPGLAPELRGLRFIHLTDLHLRRSWHPAYDRLAERIRSADADLLLFTGDMVDNKVNPEPAMPTVRRLCAGLTARHGCFAILGNHDRLHFIPCYRDLPLELISGKVALVRHNGGLVELIGLPGATRRGLSPGFVSSIPPAPPAAVRIVLSHYPDHLPRCQSLQPDVFLAGHTHGGQVCLPGGVPIMKHDKSPRSHCAGIHRVGPTWLVVGRGFGYTTLPLRVFCPPEVLEITLQ